jgi:hypothetical protein
MNEQTARELTVFNRFAEVCPLGIDLDTIEKQDPPNPDILCRTIEAWVQDYLDGSPFNRVWGFEYHSDMVVFCFEEDLDLEN